MTNNKAMIYDSEIKKNMNYIKKNVKETPYDFTTRIIQEGLGLSFTFPIWRREM